MPFTFASTASTAAAALACLLAAVPLSHASGPAAGNDWAATLEADARAFHAALRDRHPGPVDPGNPGFARQLDASLARALERVPDTRGYGGYWWALREFRATFDDGHVQLSPLDGAPALPMRWPGFLTGLRDGVHVVAARADGTDVPAEGARLLDCDGVAADALAEARLGRFHGRWQLAAQREALAGQLFLDQGNPWLATPRECRFERDGEVRAVQLQWRDVGEAELARLLARVRPAPPARTGMRSAGDGLLWISMAGFNADPASEDHPRLTALLGELRDGGHVAAARRVVLDVRGNGGGSSHWSREIAALLWGDAAVAAAMEGSDGAVDWRVAQGNIDDISGFRDMLLAQESPDPELLRWSGLILDGMSAAQERDDALWRQPTDHEDAPARAPAAERPRRLREDAAVIVLTDSACASACLDALDLWLPLGATHAGAATSADTVYMEVGSAELPGGLSRIGLPMKVYRGRARGNNEPYLPAHPFPAGPMDDAALEAWIRSL